MLPTQLPSEIRRSLGGCGGEGNMASRKRKYFILIDNFISLAISKSVKRRGVCYLISILFLANYISLYFEGIEEK